MSACSDVVANRFYRPSSSSPPKNTTCGVAKTVRLDDRCRKWNSPYAIGVRDGIEIRVDFYPPTHPKYAGQISTAYPINVTPNP